MKQISLNIAYTVLMIFYDKEMRAIIYRRTTTITMSLCYDKPNAQELITRMIARQQ